jgi:hypothetical protein
MVKIHLQHLHHLLRRTRTKSLIDMLRPNISNEDYHADPALGSSRARQFARLLPTQGEACDGFNQVQAHQH